VVPVGVTRVRVPLGFTPRAWARQAYGLYLRHPFKDFSVNACPGAGKTKFAVMLAYNELHRGQVDRVDIVAPSRHICEQWQYDMASWGIQLDPENAHESRDCVGRVMTYQRLGMDPNAFKPRDKRRTLVVLDEIHHAGDSKSWGDALHTVFTPAHRRLLLSGTPFRSDNNPIPFVRYAEGEVGMSVSDYTYGYGEALRDSYCAPLFFPHHDGEFSWEREGQSYTASFQTLMKGPEATDRLRTALEATGEYAQGMLREAHEQLMQLRRDHPTAAGIVFGRDVANCGQLATVLQSLSGQRPVIVTNDDPEASKKIRHFRDSTRPWIVSVKMISEGVDIPRLRVGVYLSNVRTELFFRQAAGRLVRLCEGLEEQSGFLYIPSEPRLVAFAGDMQRERRHFLKAKQNEDELLLAEAQRERDTPDDTSQEYRFLQSVGERRGVIETIVEDTGQQLFDFAVEMMPEIARRVEPVPSPVPPPVELLQDKKQVIRRKGGAISSWVQDLHSRYNIPYRQIHAELNRRQGVRSQQVCTLEQLQEREQLLEKWFRTGSL